MLPTPSMPEVVEQALAKSPSFSGSTCCSGWTEVDRLIGETDFRIVVIMSSGALQWSLIQLPDMF